MIGFEIDDTLAKMSFENVFSREQILKRMREAPVLYRPRQSFVAISARDDWMREATLYWMLKNQPEFVRLHLVSGSEDEIVAGKARIIVDENLDSFTDNNREILGKLRELLPATVELFWMRQDGTRVKY